MLGYGTSSGLVVVQLLAGYILFFVAKCLYRLTLHPLARFPGPKKAAVSRLYAMSWDIPHETSYVKEFTTWHDKYDSSIVRIEPNHLHIRDIDAYNEIFRIGTKFTRDPAIYNFPATAGSFFNELNQKEAIAHRSLFNQCFSTASVQNLEPVIQGYLSEFLSKVNEIAKSDKAVNLTLGLRCLTADTLMKYLYDKPLRALSTPDFKDQMVVNLAHIVNSGPAIAWYGGQLFVKLFRLMMKMPRDWVPHRGIRETLRILDECNARITELSTRPRNKATPSIFQTAMDPNVLKGRPKLSVPQLAADGLVFFAAGTDTTANALSFAIYHLICSPTTLGKLLTELKTAIPEPMLSSGTTAWTGYSLSWSELERLTYLHAVVKESVRMSYGVPGKLPRIVPSEGITLSGQFIPGGTTVSSTSYAYFTNPKCYVDPLMFKPERWIQDKDGRWSSNNGIDPEKYFVAFSRGSRSCMGMNLAYAQLHYTIAYLVRNFSMSLDDGMKHSDMEWHDAFTIATFGHLKVKFKKSAD